MADKAGPVPSALIAARQLQFEAAMRILASIRRLNQKDPTATGLSGWPDLLTGFVEELSQGLAETEDVDLARRATVRFLELPRSVERLVAVDAVFRTEARYWGLPLNASADDQLIGATLALAANLRAGLLFASVLVDRPLLFTTIPQDPHTPFAPVIVRDPRALRLGDPRLRERLRQTRSNGATGGLLACDCMAIGITDRRRYLRQTKLLAYDGQQL